MKRFHVLLITMLLLGLPALSWVSLAHAQSFSAGGNSTLSQDKTVDGSYYATGRTINIAGTVNGDVLCAGQDVNISGTVHGDVLCVSQTIDISGIVDGSVRVAGQSVSISGSVNHNATVAAQNFTTHNDTKIQDDLSVASSNATLNGSIGRDVAAAGNSITIAGKVNRNVKVTASDVTFTSNAEVQGNANYISNNAATVDSGAKVSNLTHSTPSKGAHRNFSGSLFGFGLIGFVYVLFAALLAVLVLVLLLPKFFHNVTEEAVKHLGATVLTGFLASIIVTVLVIALMVTVIGIPLALLLLVAWLLIVTLSMPVTAYYLGSMVLSKAKNPIPVILIGTIILVTLIFLPFAGFIVSVIGFWIGTGSLLRYIKQNWAIPSYKL